MKFLATMAVIGLIGVPSLAVADDMKMDMTKTAATGDSASSKAFSASMSKMMTNMDVKPTGNTDKDFVMMMMPHHQGAIDMAKVELQFGKDPTLHKMAQDIVAAQEKEIAEMKEWLAKNGR